MDEKLMHFLDRVPRNVPGKYFISDHCRDCGVCYDTSSGFFKPDAEVGHSYVFRQPVGAEEDSACRAAMEACPTQSIHDFGMEFDWKEHPPREGDIGKVA